MINKIKAELKELLEKYLKFLNELKFKIGSEYELSIKTPSLINN